MWRLQVNCFIIFVLRYLRHVLCTSRILLLLFTYYVSGLIKDDIILKQNSDPISFWTRHTMNTYIFSTHADSLRPQWRYVACICHLCTICYCLHDNHCIMKIIICRNTTIDTRFVWTLITQQSISSCEYNTQHNMRYTGISHNAEHIVFNYAFDRHHTRVHCLPVVKSHNGQRSLTSRTAVNSWPHSLNGPK